MVSNNGIHYNGDSTSDPGYPLIIEYRTPHIFAVEPSSGPSFGGTILVLTGVQFKNTSYLQVAMVCDEMDSNTGQYIQDTLVPIEFIKSRTLVLVTSAVIIDTARKTTVCSLEVTNNGQDYSRNGAVFLYYTLYIESISPPSGSIDGGTEVIITGFGFQDVADLHCRFHNVTSPARLVRPERLQCETPSFSGIFPNFNISENVNMNSSWTVSLEVTNNLKDFTSQNKPFIYDLRPSIISISPTFVVGNSLAEILVTLNDSNQYQFIDHDGPGGFSRVYFKFDTVFDGIVRVGQIVNTSVVLCTSPPLVSGSTAYISISNNLQDYSTELVLFEYVNQTDGTYVEASVEVVCPAGSYCPKSTINQEMGIAPRYHGAIPCDRGYYQPEEGQTECRVCQRGYSCSHRGMTASVTCRAGHVCEVNKVPNILFFVRWFFEKTCCQCCSLSIQMQLGNFHVFQVF